MPDVIADMLRSRRLERVAVNRSHARGMVEMAEQHVRTATVLATTHDHAMAFTAAYDAARKALAAVLAVEGLRVRPVGGAHRNTVVAAAVYVEDDALTHFDWMRQVRNATEYPDGDTGGRRRGVAGGVRDRRSLRRIRARSYVDSRGVTRLRNAVECRINV